MRWWTIKRGYKGLQIQEEELSGKIKVHRREKECKRQDGKQVFQGKGRRHHNEIEDLRAVT